MFSVFCIVPNLQLFVNCNCKICLFIFLGNLQD
nr:MAG TPA: hypothetical protein [Caudoviricetes sp.]